jgi:cyclomaltodextrinase / maltogenic alpha-amylase / neopullulanase
MKKHILLIALMSSLITFANGQSTADVFGLLTPIQLTETTTDVPLEDYFMDVNRIERVEVVDALKADLSKDKKVLTVRIVKNAPILSNMDIILRGGNRYSFLLKASQRKVVKMSLKDDGYKKVAIKGEMNAWNPADGVLKKVGANWEIDLNINAGNYEYQFVADGVELKDPNCKTSSTNNKNSLLILPKPDPKKVSHLFTSSTKDNQITIGFNNKPTKTFAYWDNHLILSSAHNWRQNSTDSFTNNAFNLTIPTEATFKKRSFIRVFSVNTEGVSNDMLIPLENGKVVSAANQLDRSDKEAQIMYFVLLDRFNNGNKKNDNPVRDLRVHPMANWQGGDLEGVTQKINDGYFKSMNINALWLSPITKNPDSAYREYPAPHRWYTGYHGYWPTLSSMVDPHFGNDKSMQTMVDAAHTNGINVLLDYVCHHVHVEHPIYKQHPNWVTAFDLPNGQKNIRIWDEQRLTTWFDDFIPTLDLSRPEVVAMNTDSTIYWLNKFNLDGFRHDASKHIPLPFWRSLTRRLKTDAVAKGKPIYQIGETYGARELIQSYIGTGMMDAQFDFPVYFDSREVLAKDSTTFESVETTVRESFNYFGYHNTMGYITGNHDQARFVSLAGGGLKWSENDREAGFQRKVEVGDKIGYNRLQMMTALMFSLPGVPVIFYGDEIGIPGAGDPDSRRMMRFSKWSKSEKNTKKMAEKITFLRRNRLSLTYGDTEILHVSKDAFVLMRDYFGEVTISVFNKSREAATVSFDLPERFKDIILKGNFEGKVGREGVKVSVQLAGARFEMLTN